MKTNLKGRDFINLRDFNAEELETILEVAFELKGELARGQAHPLLAGKTLGMLFGNASTRTRISFETAMTQLGGHAQYYAPEQMQLFDSGESLKDTAHVMSRYLDGIIVRLTKSIPHIPQLSNLKYGDGYATIQRMAKDANIPVINAACDKEHPCQVMADLMTIIEKMGRNWKDKKMSIVWVPNRKWVTPGTAHTFAIAAGILGMKLTYAYPEGFDLDQSFIDEGRALARKTGGRIEITNNLNEALKDTSILYAKAWGLLNESREEDAKRRENYLDWCIQEEHFKHTAADAIFMNCMPIERDREASAAVMDGPRSALYDEAENRLHAQKAVLSLVMR